MSIDSIARGLASVAYDVPRNRRSQNIYSFNSNYLKNFRAACGKVRAGMAGATAYRAIIAFVGDSKYAGAGADGSSGSMVAVEPISKPSFFCTELTAKGLNNNRNTCFGYRGTGSPANMTLYDPRIVFDAALAHSGILPSLGGNYFRLSGLVTQAFTTTGTVDRAEVYTRRSSGDGTMTVTATASGATVLATIDANGADAVVKTPITFQTLAQHTLNMQRISGSFVYPIGIRCWNNALSGFDVINAGAYGTTSSFHADTGASAWAAANVLGSLTNLAIVCIQLSTNDPGAAISLATSLANIQVLITKGQAAGADVVLECPTDGPDATWGTPAQREALRQGIIALGASNGCLVMDNATRFISYADAFARGFMGASVHESAPGYADEARFLAGAVLI